MSAAEAIVHPTLPDLVFVALPFRGCGNCRHWKGTRVSNGRSGFVCLANSVGRCCNNQRLHQAAVEKLGEATPLANSDCSYWKSGL